MDTLKTNLEIVLGETGMFAHPIPPITEPMGMHWRQPPRQEIELDDTHAMMSEAAFKQLAEYSCTVPTGVYEGKMWKANTRDGWMLRWFGTCDDPKCCSNNQRKILIV